jgi:aspartate carbamoyltransferase catalytic subunit
MNPARDSLLGIEHLEAAEILRLLKFARRMNPDKPRPLLKGRRVLLLFYEASTRTRSSFEIAAKSLGAHTVLIQAIGSSIEKNRCWTPATRCGRWARISLSFGIPTRARPI